MPFPVSVPICPGVNFMIKLNEIGARHTSFRHLVAIGLEFLAERRERSAAGGHDDESVRFVDLHIRSVLDPPVTSLCAVALSADSGEKFNEQHQRHQDAADSLDGERELDALLQPRAPMKSRGQPALRCICRRLSWPCAGWHHRPSSSVRYEPMYRQSCWSRASGGSAGARYVR